MRGAFPRNTTSLGHGRWADWFRLPAPSGPDPRRAATADRPPKDRDDNAARAAFARRLACFWNITLAQKDGWRHIRGPLRTSVQADKVPSPLGVTQLRERPGART